MRRESRDAVFKVSARIMNNNYRNSTHQLVPVAN